MHNENQTFNGLQTPPPPLGSTENAGSLWRSNCFNAGPVVYPLWAKATIIRESSLKECHRSLPLPRLPLPGDWQRTRRIHPIECHANTQPPRPAVLWLLLVWPGYWPVLRVMCEFQRERVCVCVCVEGLVCVCVVCIRDGLEGHHALSWPYLQGSEAAWRDQSESQTHCLLLWWRKDLCVHLCVCVCVCLCVCVYLETRWHSPEPLCSRVQKIRERERDGQLHRWWRALVKLFFAFICENADIRSRVWILTET